jgi:DNA-3-methyladenine glycosylase II
LSEISFQLKPLPPFRLDLTAWVLRRRVDNIWDRWDGQVYRRILILRGQPVEVRVSQSGPPAKPSTPAPEPSEPLGIVKPTFRGSYSQ